MIPGIVSQGITGSGPPPGPGHRYWRIYITANNGAALYCGLAECHFLIGGVNQSTNPSNASASTYYPSTEPYKAFDGMFAPSDCWVSDSGSGDGPHWLKYDFGAGNEKDIDSVDLWGETSNTARSPRDFAIEYSDDDVSWTAAYSTTGVASWVAYVPINFAW